MVLLNSWEAGNVVITFTTRISGPDYAKVQAEEGNASGSSSAADYAKLVAISMANSAYAKSEWGDPVYDPAYKKIEWK